ncbi:MAG: alpha/beta fold hydrolase [Polaribacter sp.]
MPILNSDFSPTIPFKNGHFSTIYGPLFLKEDIKYARERLLTWDQDFIDLDFSKVGGTTVAILIHGLEGSSFSHYMTSNVKYLNKKNIDTVCFNLRGCSGEDNNILATYHSGKTDDLDFVVNHIVEKHYYKNIILIGFSLGGNLTLKYLGEKGSNLFPNIKGGIACSVPIDIASAEKKLENFENKLYMGVFFKTMKNKILDKSIKFPEYKINTVKLLKATKFKHLEHLYTVPVFGFKSPEDYWEKASSKPYILKIKVPTLLLNAKDDSFLSKKCYPIKEAKESEFFFFETPSYGGHCGFISRFKKEDNTWLQERIFKFITTKIGIANS